MKRNTLIVFSALALIPISIFVFFNAETAYQSYEVVYQGNGIPLSELVASTPNTSEPGSESLSKNILNWKRVEIEPNEVVFIDQSVDIDELIINGELHCDQSVTDPIEIKASTIYVNGIFQCGTQNSPFTNQLTISLKPRNVNPLSNPSYRGFIVNSNGKLILNGSSEKAGYLKLNQTLEPGQSNIVLSSSVQTIKREWEVGDQIVIAPSSYSFHEDEEFIITAINGTSLTLDHPALYRHWGQTEIFSNPPNPNVVLDQRAEVINLNRNIKIQSDESTSPISDADQIGAELGGHLMVMALGQAYINSVEFKRMGQAGIMARYPMHWHIVGNAQNQFIKNSSIHRSFQRCLTIHRTDNVLVSNNSCYNIKGHAFFLEDGTEKNNIITSNIGIKAKYPYFSKRLLDSDRGQEPNPFGIRPERAPNTSIFWISHPQNIVTDNIAAGSVGSGFWMAFEEQVTENGSTLYPSKTNTLSFERNQAHSNVLGFTWSFAPGTESANNPNNPNDMKITSVTYQPTNEAQFKKLIAYKNSMTGFYTIAKNGVFDQVISADNGLHYFITFNQRIENSFIFGRSQNHTTYDQNLLLDNVLSPGLQTFNDHRKEQKGIIIYDGPLKLNNVKFINFPTQLVYHTANSQQYSVTPIPFGMNFGFENFANSVKNISFHPVPYHKMKIDKGSRELAMHMRDTDGSLTGTAGALVLGKSSISPINASDCIDGGETFKNLKICSPSTKEIKLHILNGTNVRTISGSLAAPASTTQPFVARRSDGIISDELVHWGHIFNLPPPQSLDYQTLGKSGRTKIGLPNSSMIDIELMSKTVNPELWTISEFPNATVPVTKMIAQGNNCVLAHKDNNPPALSVNSLSALKNATETAYYTSGEDFYFRIIPNQLSWFHSGQTSDQYISYNSYPYTVQCAGDVVPKVKGKISSITYSGQYPNRTAVIKGWACHFSQNTKINVTLSVNAANSAESSAVIFGTVIADLLPSAHVAFDCGVQGSSPQTKGYQFEFALPSSFLNQQNGKRIFVKGISALSGINNSFLEGSGVNSLPSLPITQK
jgi:hypothetical protein